MRKFEYDTDNVDYGSNKKNIMKERGNNGWELVVIENLTYKTFSESIIYWKREIKPLKS